MAAPNTGSGQADIPYPDHFELFARAWLGSTQAQVDHLLERNHLGENPTGLARRALAFEVSCLHLYLVDRHIRDRRTDDDLLNDYWRWGARGLLAGWDLPLSDEQRGAFIGWRLGRYEDVTASVEADDTYPSFAVKADDYLYRLAEQFCLCVSADVTRGGDVGLYLHKVDEGLLGDIDQDPVAAEQHRQFHDAARMTKHSLRHATLPLFLVARLWGAGGTFYERALEELQKEAGQGAEEARELCAAWDRSSRRQREKLFWDKRLGAGATFVAADAGTEDGGEPEEEDGPHVTIRPADAAEGGKPLGHWLLFAYDQVAGLKTRDEETGLPARLSLGEVQTLLTEGTFGFGDYFGGSPDAPDLTGEVTVQPVPKWVLGGASRHVYALYEGLGVEPLVSLVEDSLGARAVLIAPCPTDEFLRLLQWAVPGDTTLWGEPEPDLARFSLWDLGPGESTKQASVASVPGVRQNWRDAVEGGDARFAPAGLYAHGPGGMPMEIMRLGNDEGADFSLRRLALTCYDHGRGLLVEDPDAPGTMAFGLLLGDIIHYLRFGELYVPRTPEDYQPRGEESVNPPRPVTDLELPAAARRDLTWAFERYGLEPQGCAFEDEEGATVVVLDVSGIPEDAGQSLWKRFLIGLPTGVRCYAGHLPEACAFPLSRADD